MGPGLSPRETSCWCNCSLDSCRRLRGILVVMSAAKLQSRRTEESAGSALWGAPCSMFGVLPSPPPVRADWRGSGAGLGPVDCWGEVGG